MSPQSHKCDACGGTTRQDTGPWGGSLCYVCLGAGMISDRMPVSDALTDAATFSRVYYDEDLNKRIYGPRIDALDLDRAGMQCVAAIERSAEYYHAGAQ